MSRIADAAMVHSFHHPHPQLADHQAAQADLRGIYIRQGHWVHMYSSLSFETKSFESSY